MARFGWLKATSVAAVCCTAVAGSASASPSGNSLLPGWIRDFAIAGVGGVPADAAAVVLNVTAVDAEGDGFVTVYPCGQPLPSTSSLNVSNGATVANSVIAHPGAEGSVCVAMSSGLRADVIVDVSGWFVSGSSQWFDAPKRIVSTRDGIGAAKAKVMPGTPLRFGLNGPAGSSAAVVNVTATNAAADGFLTVYPCGQSVPEISNVNFRAGRDVPNAAVAVPGPSGEVCVAASSQVDVIIDQAGWLTTSFTSLPVPTRLLDTRNGIGGATAAVAAGSTREFVLPTAPTGATAAVVNVTAARAFGAGFLTVYPCGTPVPNVSNLNFTAGGALANLAVLRPGFGNKICVYASMTTDVLIDLNGWMTAGYQPATTPSRFADSRQCAFVVATDNVPTGGLNSVDTSGILDMQHSTYRTLFIGTYNVPHEVVSYGEPLVARDCYVYAIESRTTLDPATTKPTSSTSTLIRYNPHNPADHAAVAILDPMTGHRLLGQDVDGSLLMGSRNSSGTYQWLDRVDPVSGTTTFLAALNHATSATATLDTRTVYAYSEYVHSGQPANTREIVAFDVANHTYRTVTRGLGQYDAESIDVSPDGTTLLVSLAADPAGFELIDTGTGTATPLPWITAVRAQWLSDGRIAYVDRSQPTTIQVRNANGTTRTVYAPAGGGRCERHVYGGSVATAAPGVTASAAEHVELDGELDVRSAMRGSAGSLQCHCRVARSCGPLTSAGAAAVRNAGLRPAQSRRASCPGRWRFAG